MNTAGPIYGASESRIRQLRDAGDELLRGGKAEAALRVTEDPRRAAFAARTITRATRYCEADALEAQELQRLLHTRQYDGLLTRRADQLRARRDAHAAGLAATESELAAIEAAQRVQEGRTA